MTMARHKHFLSTVLQDSVQFVFAQIIRFMCILWWGLGAEMSLGGVHLVDN